jgi:multiple sugar transport system ATP-binding protein
VRPEDLALVEPAAGHLAAPVYSFELTGESTLVTVRIGEQLVCAKGDRHYRREIGEPVGMRIDAAHAYLFDATSEARLRPDGTGDNRP